MTENSTAPENVCYRTNRIRVDGSARLLEESHLRGSQSPELDFLDVSRIIKGLVQENIKLANRIEELKRR